MRAEDFAVGSLVRARGRDWVVLPESEGDLLQLRPLAGTEDERTGILLPLETVEASTFALPDPSRHGDFISAGLLRDAVRLGFRSSAGPFRSFGHLAVDPRPYQLVPLLMALKLDPVRLLIADDVGIGKTIEAGLIARELLDRGEIRRTAVLCPPHLAEQWQVELAEKFQIEAELVLPGTVRRLERTVGLTESVFQRYPHVIVSLDYIKRDTRRDDFLRACPEFVIVDEAHTCATSGESDSQHQRHALVRALSDDEERHLVLVTATPHSGKEEAFRSLLSLLDRNLAMLPDDLSGPENARHRRRLSQHFVQRRRGDIRRFLDTETAFPQDRKDAEVTYELSPEYAAVVNQALDFAERTMAETRGRRDRRLHWWAVLGLLRALVSSPAAAVETLRSRAEGAALEDPDEIDEAGRRSVLDLLEDENPEGMDVTPGAVTDDDRRAADMRKMARSAAAVAGDKDAKLQRGMRIVEELLQEGLQPIVFCRFIATAEYLGAALRARLGPDVEVCVVTGTLPPDERKRRVEALEAYPTRVLVATDCLSEGVNLQKIFTAVVHYDLSWNPTRHEQREGRVDRYGQPSDKVRVVTYYGTDNRIDGVVLDVLIRKHKAIRNSLGISVPVPAHSDQALEAIFEGLLLRERAGSESRAQLAFDSLLKEERKQLFEQWDDAAEREKRSRTRFAQERIDAETVAGELASVREALGAPSDVERFLSSAVRLYGGRVHRRGGPLSVDLADAPASLRDLVGQSSFTGRVEPPVRAGEIHLHRTHTIVEGIANHVLNGALDPEHDSPARRAGVIETDAVDRRTTLLLLRLRFLIRSIRRDGGDPLLAEDLGILGFRGSPGEPEWLDERYARSLLEAEPVANVPAFRARDLLRAVVDGYPHLEPELESFVKERGEAILAAHRRVRSAARDSGTRYSVEPQLPPDVLGIYLLIPSRRQR